LTISFQEGVLVLDCILPDKASERASVFTFAFTYAQGGYGMRDVGMWTAKNDFLRNLPTTTTATYAFSLLCFILLAWTFFRRLFDGLVRGWMYAIYLASRLFAAWVTLPSSRRGWFGGYCLFQ